MIREFKFYLEEGSIKKSEPNLALASSLIKDMESRIKDVCSFKLNQYPKLVFENVYDALRDFADALLALDGFKSYLHEASFSYLKKYNFDGASLFILDKFRY